MSDDRWWCFCPKIKQWRERKVCEAKGCKKMDSCPEYQAYLEQGAEEDRERLIDEVFESLKGKLQPQRKRV